MPHALRFRELALELRLDSWHGAIPPPGRCAGGRYVGHRSIISHIGCHRRQECRSLATVERRGQPEADATGDALDVSIETVRTVIRARRLRGHYLSEELFAGSAWDMLLDLLQSELTRLRVPVSSLCIAAAVPATTALR